MIWLLSIFLAASVILNICLLAIIWDMTSRHHAHALTLIDVNDELLMLRSQLEQTQSETDSLKASGRLLI